MSESLRRAAVTFFLVLFTAAITFAPANRTELQAQTSSNPDFRYWKLTGNSGTNPSTNFLGTTDNQPLIVKVNGTRVYRLEPTRGTPNIIGGFSGNAVTADVEGATIAGGGDSTVPNKVTGIFGTVSGGWGNTASFRATVGGGVNNTAGSTAVVAGGFGNTSSGTVGGGALNTAGPDATVAGGFLNTASGVAATVGGGEDNTAHDYAAVGGGDRNTASGNAAVVGGGILNTASGLEASVAGGLQNGASGNLAAVGGGRENTATGVGATVPGGFLNAAEARFAFAAGQRAKAKHQGAFVWGDSSDADVASTGPNQFIARASGGTTFYSNSSLTAGVQLPPGGGSWSSLSDASAKDDVSQVDAEEILRGVASLPISTWKYESQDPSIRHIGPMAQDFKEAFGVGENERYITSVDADGVALAAIQGLNAKIDALEERLARNRRSQTTPPTVGVWQAAALLVLALGIGLAGTRVREPAGGWWSTR